MLLIKFNKLYMVKVNTDLNQNYIVELKLKLNYCLQCDSIVNIVSKISNLCMYMYTGQVCDVIVLIKGKQFCCDIFSFVMRYNVK